MELFTLGRGNYTENDVKEAARAFTGWGYGPQGDFLSRPNQHDDGSKTFLGQTGNFDGRKIRPHPLRKRCRYPHSPGFNEQTHDAGPRL